MGGSKPISLTKKGNQKMRKLVTPFILVCAMLLSATPEAHALFGFGNKKQETTQLSGTVTNIDLRKSIITVTSKDGTTSTVMVEDKTTFTKKGKRLGLFDLKKGDSVRIDYFVKKGQNRAHAVKVDEIVTSKPKPATPTQKKKK
jgi:hypothetical protein